MSFSVRPMLAWPQILSPVGRWGGVIDLCLKLRCAVDGAERKLVSIVVVKCTDVLEAASDQFNTETLSSIMFLNVLDAHFVEPGHQRFDRLQSAGQAQLRSPRCIACLVRNLRAPILADHGKRVPRLTAQTLAPRMHVSNQLVQKKEF